MICRVPLDPRPTTLVLAVGELCRVSLAWWADEDPDPVFVAGPGETIRTVVIRWPTDRRGRVDEGAVRAGRAAALIWTLGPQLRDRLAELAQRWPLRRHDLLVGADQVEPCRDTLRSLVPSELADRVVAELSGA